MKADVYVATSLDGFIAREDGAIDWLPNYGTMGEDYGYHAFLDTVDAHIMGRNTFEKVLSFDVPWPYSKPVYVWTSKEDVIPESHAGKAFPVSGSPQYIAAILDSERVERAYIDGAATTQAFINAGYVDRIIVTTIPILIGSGIPLFGELDKDLQLNFVASKSWPSGLSQTTYSVKP